MTVLFAVTTILAAAVALGLAIANASLSSAGEKWRARYEQVVSELISTRGKNADIQNQLEEFLHPPTRGMTEPIDAEAVIANSDDPIWSLVEECSDLKTLWELRTPGEGAKQPHQRYADYATFILNLPESEQTRGGVAKAIACMDAVDSAEGQGRR